VYPCPLEKRNGIQRVGWGKKKLFYKGRTSKRKKKKWGVVRGLRCCRIGGGHASGAQGNKRHLRRTKSGTGSKWGPKGEKFETNQPIKGKSIGESRTKVTGRKPWGRRQVKWVGKGEGVG